MPTIVVKTQAEIDALPDSFAEYTIIQIHGGTTWSRLKISKKWENASAELRENASAVLRGNASAVLWENASAVLRENASAVLWGNASAELRENASAVLRGNASAVLRGNASAVLWGNASAELWGNASAVLRENASAELRENASAHIQSQDCSAELFGFAVAWLLAKATKVKARAKTAHIIKPEYKEGVDGWLEKEGVEIDGKTVVLFKRVSKAWQTQEDTANETIWKPGTTLEHPSWNPKSAECGEGKFHACSRPYFCNEFRNKPGDRYVAIEIAVKDLYAWPKAEYPHKIAFRKGKVLFECDKMGREKK